MTVGGLLLVFYMQGSVDMTCHHFFSPPQRLTYLGHDNAVFRVPAPKRCDIATGKVLGVAVEQLKP